MTAFFDPTEVEREPVVEVVDEGIYLVQIAKAIKKEDNFGLRLRVFYRILSLDESKGKMLMENFNLGHAKPDVERISKQQFAKMLDCIGLGDKPLEKESDIEGKQLKLDVLVVPHYQDPSQTQNKIKRHLPLNAIDLNASKSKGGDDVPF